MTWSFNINNRDYVTVNHVIFNPTFKCNVGCPSCYLTSFERKSSPEAQDSNQWMFDWIKDCLTENSVLCNQVSISINTNNRNTVADAKTRMLLEGISLINDSDRTDTDLAVSISHRDFMSYLEDIAKAKANIISLSVDSYKEIPCGYGRFGTIRDMLQRIHFIKIYYKDQGLPEPILNINMLVNRDFNPGVLSELIRQPEIDHIYLIMEKPALGKPYYNNEEHKERSMWYKSYSKLEELVRDQDRSEKVSFDGCFVDSRSKTTCAEGLNLMSVWPNKALTGCPYAGGERGKTVPSDIQGFADVVRYYRLVRRTDRDWDQCKIPEIDNVKRIRQQGALPTRD